MATSRLLVCGLTAAAWLLASGRARAEDPVPCAISEHALVQQDTFEPGPDLTEGDSPCVETESDETRLIQAHARASARWTSPFLGPDFFPRLAASTLLAATHDRAHGRDSFSQRLDLSLYWLQIEIPTFSVVGSTLSRGQVANFDLLIPWRIDDHQRLGLLLGTGLGLSGGGFDGLRSQLVYGLTAGPLDLEGRAGYGLERTSLARFGLPEWAPASSSDVRNAELLYGVVVGARWAQWGRVALEVNGAHLIDTHQNLLTFAPGVKLMAGGHGPELGVAALFDFDTLRPQNEPPSLRGIGGLVSLRYNFL